MRHMVPSSPPRSDARAEDDTSAAWSDWLEGTRNVPLWWTLAWYDTVLRYRRSILGPLWLTISMGLLLIGTGPLYSALFHVPLERFFPHLTLGIIFWTFFTTTITDGCNVFIGAASYLKAGEFSGSVFVWRTLARNVIQLLHHLVLFVPVALWSGIRPTPLMLQVLPGAVFVLVNLHAVCISLGVICARFRDVTLIMTSVLQMLMFLTPVFWLPEALPSRAKFVLYNPLAQMLDVVRLPLLGGHVAPGTWRFLGLFTILNVAVAAGLYARNRRRIVYWL
jgi:lipopolysaccharide transport system permease protein